MKRFSLLSLLLISVGFYQLYGQCIPPAPPLPDMFVEKDTSIARNFQFSQVQLSKFEQLKNVNSLQDLFFIYSATEINALLRIINNNANGIRIYFALYDSECEDSGLEEMEERKMILLFANDVPKGTKRKFYFISEKMNDNEVHPVNIDCAKKWIKNFNDIAQLQLRKTLTPKQADDADEETSGVFSDTKSIYYSEDNIQDAFVAEQARAHIDKNGKDLKITAFKMEFSAYEKHGRQPTSGDGSCYKNRLFIQFEYMYDVGAGEKRVFYLDDMRDFVCRKNVTMEQNYLKQVLFSKNKILPGKNEILALRTKMEKAHQKIKKGALAIDNGQLCPTHCPPPPPPGG